MDEKDASDSFMFISEESIDSLYPMFLGVSCSYFALKLLPEPEICDDKWLDIRSRMLKGSANLLGLFVWRFQREEEARIRNSELLQKLEDAQAQIEELKQLRSEDAKANQKVVSIVAAREHSWFDERKKLRQQIGALINDLRVLEMKKEKTIFELNEKLKGKEDVLVSKDKLIEEGEKKRLEIEEKLRNAENLENELRETLKRESQRHSCEISKHKTAFIELVSNQRQLEAEMARAVRQVEAAKQELDAVLKEKEEFVLMNQKLSMEIVKTHKDLEQKDQVLSAMLRKSMLDTAEKQMLLKEAKSSKAKWREVSESKHERHSLRNMLTRRVNVKSDVCSGGKGVKGMMSLDAGNFRSVENGYHLEFKKHEIKKGLEDFSLISHPYLSDATNEPPDVEHLENWVSSEATYKFAIEQKHNIEIDAFAEQIRLKDEKVEALHWRLLSMEIESKRLHSHIESLNRDITKLRQENMKLEAQLLDREAELHSLKEQLVLQFNPPNLHKLNFSPSLHETDTVWSKVKVIKRKPGHKSQENDKGNEIQANKEQHKDIVLTLKPKDIQIQVSVMECTGSEDVANTESSSLVVLGSGKQDSSAWKMDIHALGVSYKIKRLKQQLVMLERLTGKQESCENDEKNNSFTGTKGFFMLMSLLSKQVERYQSLQGKIDDICKRMHENDLNLNCGCSSIARTEIECKRLEHFLEETFQLQRYIVATGQKLMEVQAKIASAFVSDAEGIEKPESFDMKRFADSIRTLFREVQRGLEVRISRIIGDLEGTLACDGIIHFKK